MTNRMHKQFLVAMLGCITMLFTGQSQVIAQSAGLSDFLDGSSSFSSGSDITVNALFNGNPALFGVSGCCIGVQGGNNNNAVDNVDGEIGGGDDESLEIILGSGIGLSGIDFTFTRALPISITGFTANPLASSSIGAVVPTYISSTGTLEINHPWQGNAVTEITFGNPGASSGQTLDLIALETAPNSQFVLSQLEWQAASPIIPGDVDGDGDVDLVETGGDGISDFDLIRDNWFNDDSPTRAMGDLNADGIVEFQDFAEWKAAFPFPIVGSIEAGFRVVPEPTSLVLLSFALVGLGSKRRR